MDAIVIKTGDIITVYKGAEKGKWFGYDENGEKVYYNQDELKFDFISVLDQAYFYEPDYWDKLEHQAAIAAMQGILSNPEFPKHSREGYYKKNVANNAKVYAQELIKTIRKDTKWEQQETD